MRGRVPRTPSAAVLLPLAALAAVIALDALAVARAWPLAVRGLLDEPAHLLTAWLALAAAGPRVPRRFVVAALVASVAVDVDHVPLYLGLPVGTMPGGRPVTHSLVLAAVLVLAGSALPRARLVLSGLAAGLALHVARDLVSGWGAPLLWPLADVNVRIAPIAYYAALAAVALVAGGVRLRGVRLSSRSGGTRAGG